MKRKDLSTAVIAFFVLSLVLVVFHPSALAADPVPKERKTGEQLSRQWTVMLYFDGDNGDLEGDFITAFQKMAKDKLGSNEMANIVVQFDRIPGYDTSITFPKYHCNK